MTTMRLSLYLPVLLVISVSSAFQPPPLVKRSFAHFGQSVPIFASNRRVTSNRKTHNLHFSSSSSPTSAVDTAEEADAATPKIAQDSFSPIPSVEEKEEELQPQPASPPLVQRKYETFLWKHNLHNYDINYRVEGPIDGQPILLVHGFGANVNHFRYQFPALVNAGYRVYAIDLIGFGASDKPKDESYCIELWIDLLVEFVQTMDSSSSSSTNNDEKRPKWIIAGNSIGGLCSLGVCERLPNLIKGCVLFNCAGGMTGFRYEELPLYLRPVLWFLQKVVLGPNLGGRFFENFKSRENVESILLQQGVYRDTTNVNEELIEMLLGPADDDGAQEVFLKVFAGPPGPTPESLLPNVKCPVLALWGDADPWTPVDRGLHPGNTFGNYTDDYTLVVLPNVGHCPHDECPDLVHEKMLPWLAELQD